MVIPSARVAVCLLSSGGKLWPGVAMHTFGAMSTLSPITTSALSRITQSKLMCTCRPSVMLVPMSHQKVGATVVSESRSWPKSSSRMAFLSLHGVHGTLNLSHSEWARSIADRKTSRSPSSSLVMIPRRARSMKSMVGEWQRG